MFYGKVDVLVVKIMNKQKLRGKVLIICNHNSARSQIAEGLLKSLYSEY